MQHLVPNVLRVLMGGRERAGAMEIVFGQTINANKKVKANSSAPPLAANPQEWELQSGSWEIAHRQFCQTIQQRMVL